MRYLELSIENMEDYAARGGFGSWRVLDWARRLRSAPTKLEDFCRLLETAAKEIHAMKAAAPNNDAVSLGDFASQLRGIAIELGCDELVA